MKFKLTFPGRPGLGSAEGHISLSEGTDTWTWRVGNTVSWCLTKRGAMISAVNEARRQTGNYAKDAKWQWTLE